MSIFIIFIKDGIFAAIAAIGFSSISNTDRKLFLPLAVIAAFGHMTRLAFLNYMHCILPLSSFFAALLIGILSIPASRIFKAPAECMAYPALLPMIPGMYAYRTIQALIQCMSSHSEPTFVHYLYLLEYNWIICMVTIVAMVFGVTLPIFLLRKRSLKYC